MGFGRWGRVSVSACVSLCKCLSHRQGEWGLFRCIVEEYTQNRPVTILGKKKKIDM